MSDGFTMGVHIGPAEDATAASPPAVIPTQVIPMAPTSVATEVATVAQNLRDAIKRANGIIPNITAAVDEFHKHLDAMESRHQQLAQLNQKLKDAEQP